MLPPADDTRGILDPAALRAVVSLERYPAGDELAGVVDWFWAVAWALPDGAEHVQRVLTHPAANLSVGAVDRAGRVLSPARGHVYGVVRHLDQRRLTGHGWTVAAKTTGGLGLLTGRPAHTLVGAELALDDALGLPGVAARVEAAGPEAERVERLREALEQVVRSRPRAVVAQAREVAALVAVAEHDRSMTRAEQLAAAAGVGLRTLQRRFAQHLGASPGWVIRRWRLLEAADRAARQEPVAWAALAGDLGYADQAHLVRDFTTHLGTTPAAYAQRQRPGGRPADLRRSRRT